MLANVNQLAELYTILETEMRINLAKTIYIPYGPLGGGKLQMRLKDLESMIDSGSYKSAVCIHRCRRE